jgi:hypothetical protein
MPRPAFLIPRLLRIGAAVRLRSYPDVTGVVVDDCDDIDRVFVRWDDNREVTNCLKAMLERAQPS